MTNSTLLTTFVVGDGAAVLGAVAAVVQVVAAAAVVLLALLGASAFNTSLSLTTNLPNLTVPYPAKAVTVGFPVTVSTMPHLG